MPNQYTNRQSASCVVDGCERKPLAKSLCNIHYARLRVHGSATAPASRCRRGSGRVPVVDSSGGPDACWPWMGHRDSEGYGRYGGQRAHRIAARNAGMDISGKFVCHRCDNPPCCNPAHLFVGTALDNARDMVSKGRQSLGDSVPAESRRRGSQHPKHKIDEHDAKAIRDAHAAGASMYGLARTYGLSRPTVSAIIHHKTWRHVQPIPPEVPRAD